MKIFKTPAIVAMALAAVSAISSCSNEKFELDMRYVRFSQFNDYNEEGYWAQCYEESSNSGAEIDGALFSHEAQATEYGGVTYYSWNGFCPSKVYDTNDYTAEGTWLDHQWGAMESSIWHSTHKGYVIGDWDVREPSRPETLTGDEACVIALANGAAFTPMTLHVSNTAYGYYTMVNGSAFSKAFGPEDYLRLIVTGFLDGVKTGSVEINLAANNVFLTNFTEVDIASLGLSVDRLVFTMEGSDSGQWGLNTPAYFAIGGFSYAIEE